MNEAQRPTYRGVRVALGTGYNSGGGTSCQGSAAPGLSLWPRLNSVGVVDAGTPAEKWYEGIEEWRKGQYFFSHITEIIRLATLYKYGGVYLDTDVVVMQELYDLHNVVGTELAGSRGESKVRGATLQHSHPKRPHCWNPASCSQASLTQPRSLVGSPSTHTHSPPHHGRRS